MSNGSVNEARAVALTQELIRIKSQYSPDPADGVSEHQEITAFLVDLYKKLGGFEVHCVEASPGYPVVVARLRGIVGHPVLAFVGHYNTQPIGDPAAWTVNPFGGDLKDARIWGRGSGDMKKAIAAVIEATRAFMESGATLKGDLLHIWFAGEGGHESALDWIVGPGRAVAGADWYIDTDGGPRIAKVDAPLIWAELTTRGRGGHPTFFLEDGTKPVNAFNKMMKLLSHLVDVDEWMSYQGHPLYNAPWRTSPKPIVDVTRIRGGAFDQVPDECTAQISFNLLPSQTPETFKDELDALIDRVRAGDAEFEPVEYREIRRFYTPRRWELSEDHPVVLALRTFAERFGVSVGFWGCNSGVRSQLWEIGEVITFGVPGGDRAHAVDESTSIQGLVNGIQIYLGAMSALVGSHATKLDTGR